MMEFADTSPAPTTDARSCKQESYYSTTRNLRGERRSGKRSTVDAPSKAKADSLQLSFGQRIGQYEIIRLLGRGGMGEVYQARDLRLARLVAIKFLNTSTPVRRERFLSEARTTARCVHENIVVIHDADTYRGCPYLVLEYLEGQTLRHWWQDSGAVSTDAGDGRECVPLSPRRSLEVMVPVVRALACAHDHGIVHRDLKPENVMVTEHGTIKVLDFGVAKQLGEAGGTVALNQRQLGRADGASLTSTDGLVGTLPYMSPEQLCGAAVDHRSDLWAVGVMLFELVVGERPATRPGRSLLLEVTDLGEPMPSALERVPTLGPLGSIIDRCLIKSRGDRIESAHALLAELEALLPGRPVTRTRESPFTGLSAFQGEDADRFFGRENDIIDLVSRVRRQPLVAVVGPSGAGKSSLVRAGLIPALERSGEGWVAHILRPGQAPTATLASLLGALSGRATSEADGRPSEDTGAAIDAAALRAEPGLFGASLREWARRKKRQVLIVVEQLEELYTLGADAAERAAFSACLDGAADDPSAPLRVLFTLRSDFFERVAENRLFLERASRGLYFVTPMDRSGLRAALVRPVEDSDHSYEDAALVDDMLDELEATAGALPLLQFAASSLWSRRDRERRVLTRAGYEEMGGVAGALAVHADSVLAAMTRAQREVARTVLVRLVTPERTRAPAGLTELTRLRGDEQVTEAVIERLIDARLLVVESRYREDEQTVEIVHESLISAWPTLSGWLDESREDLIFLARLRTSALHWNQHARPEGLLWRGLPAKEASLWKERYSGELPGIEDDYISAVLALMNRTKRRRRAVIAGVMVLLSGLLSAALIALISVNEAQKDALEQARLARERADALIVAKADLESSLEDAERAWRNTDFARKRAEADRIRAEAALRESRQASEKALQARQAAEAALRKSQLASEKEQRARQAAEAALRERDDAVERLELTEEEAKEAQREAEDIAESRARTIRQALGIEIDTNVPGAVVEVAEAP